MDGVMGILLDFENSREFHAEKQLSALFLSLSRRNSFSGAGKISSLKTAVRAAGVQGTGLTLKIDGVNIGIVKSLVGINGLTLYNPPAFFDKVMLDIPEIYVDYDAAALLKKKIHLKEVRLNVKELAVVRNAEGVLNLDSLKPVQTAQSKPAAGKTEPGKTEPAPELTSDILVEEVGTVLYQDYSSGAVKTGNSR